MARTRPRRWRERTRMLRRRSTRRAHRRPGRAHGPGPPIVTAPTPARVVRTFGWPALFLAPWIIGFVVFTGGPMVASLVLSLTDYDVISAPRFVGLDNYERLLSDRNIAASLGNTIFYTALHVPLSMGLALALAMLLDKARGRTSGIFRTLFYLPSLTPPVAIGILFLLFLNPQIGLIGQVFGAFGLRAPGFTTDPDWIKPGIILMSLWGLGTTMVIYFTALRNVPVQLYDAAQIDGAGSWARFRNVTLPM